MIEKVSSEDSKKLSELTGPRYSAIKLLNRFERSDSYLDKLLNYELSQTSMPAPDKALLTEIVNGVIRWKLKLDWALTGFYYGDYQKCLNIVKNAMRIALYQIMFLEKIPPHAAINESVEVVKVVQGQKTANIVNGVLRNLMRNIENIRYPLPGDDIVYYLSVIHSHPKWMVKRWISVFGEDETIKLLQANNKRPYIPIRVNRVKMKPEELKQVFDEKELTYIQNEWYPESFLLYTNKTNIFQAELFKQGKITVQDPSQTYPVLLADPKPGMKVLDVCGAPGGKAFLAAELMNDEGVIVSLDKYSSKLKLIEEGAERLGFKSVIAELGDAENYKPDFQPDLILVDAPCTGLGTLSKKPDIKWKREPEDIIKLQKTQRKILQNAAALLAPGGILVYSTCTIEPEENVDNALWFLDQFKNFILEPAEDFVNGELCSNGMVQIYSHRHTSDGAFAVRFKKLTD